MCDPFLFVKFPVVGLLVIHMRKAGAQPVPGVIGIAPDTMQVAEAGPDKNGGDANAFPFSLDGIKDFRPAIEAGEFEFWLRQLFF